MTLPLILFLSAGWEVSPQENLGSYGRISINLGKVE